MKLESEAEKLRLELNAYHVDALLVPLKAEKVHQTDIKNNQLLAFSFAESNHEILKSIPLSRIISNNNLLDHSTANLLRDFFRKTAARIATRVVPLVRNSPIEQLVIIFHYDPCIPTHYSTTKIYSVCISMEEIRSAKFDKIDEDNIADYFKGEFSHIIGLYHRWLSPGVRVTKRNELK